MAEVDKDSRTHAPTPRRREEARQQDQVPKSRDVNTAALVLTVLGVGLWAVPALVEQHRQNIGQWITIAGTIEVTPETIGPILRSALEQVASLAVPIIAGAVVAGSTAQVCQVGFQIRLERLTPKLAVLNPMAGLKQIVSADGLVALAKAALKLAVVGYVAYRVVLKSGAGAEELVALGLGDILRFIGSGVFWTMAWVAAALVVIAALDFIYEYRRVEQRLKMTRQEVKDELKATEGDSTMKRRFRKFHYELTKNRMLAEVPTADVVLTNPVHVAVALRYVADVMRAPRVVAKGAGEVAEQIKEIARRAGVPIVERRALARALFRSVKVGQEIPAALYRAVAEILAYIYSLRRPRTAAAGASTS